MTTPPEPKPLRFDVALTLTAPILTRAAGALGIGIDAGMLRDPRGESAFHYTHLKGQLREAWCTLRQHTGTPSIEFMTRWLGGESDNGFEPERGALVFDAYWSAAQPQNVPHRYRVRIDEATGAVKDGALMVIESPWPSGQPVVFSGAIHAWVTDAEHVELERLLRAGFSLIPALGALKGNGFGRLESAKVTTRAARGEAQQLRPQLAAATHVGLRVQPLAPFCFARPATGSQNHFAAEPHIPGAALIAAITARCRLQPGQFPALEDALDLAYTGAPVKLTLTEARAVRADSTERPVALPLSLVSIPGGLRDVIEQTSPGPVDGNLPAFQVDWKGKDFQDAEARLNPRAANPRKMLLIRTAIDPGTGTSAENKLFSMETVVPDGCDWLANLELGRCKDPSTVLRELTHLLAEPLTHLGKTKARAKVDIEAPFSSSLASRPLTGGSVVLHLQTPAALLTDEFSAPTSGGGAALHAAYDSVWRQISNGSLSLLRFYATQRLYGGEHWWSRFRPGGRYAPRLLTNAGSVFLLCADKPAEAATLLDAWQRNGLPQPAGVRGGDDWRHNPWIAANGFGEILVNPDVAPALEGLTP